MFRLGIDEPMADALQQLTLPEMVKLAETNQLVCQFRFTDHNLINRLTQESRVDDLQQIHTGILLSSRLLRSASKDDASAKRGRYNDRKSIVQEARDIQLAMELITLGARLQMLESETQLSRGRLIKLYKELRGAHRKACCHSLPTGS